MPGAWGPPHNRVMLSSGVGLAALAVAAGAALGALLRWALSLLLNPLFAPLPLGTLAANLVGGYGIGLALGLLAQAPQLAPEWRLFIVTGFLGGLTTFSTFSAEVVAALQQGRLAWALGTAALHGVGSVALTLLGLATAAALRR
jgi:fluoride exporter